MAQALQRPLWVFLGVGITVGVVMTFGVPKLAGIDEPYHHLRSWSITSGQLMPETGPLPGGLEGGTICIPDGVVAEMYTERAPYLADLIPNWDGTDPLKVSEACEVDGLAGQRVDVATFAWYSPVGYLPQVIGVGLGRLVGDVGLQVILARLFSLAAYLALCGIAIAAAPRAKWALTAVALLPSSMFSAVTSLSPDGITIAAVLLVITGALRAADGTLGLQPRRVLIEASAVCGLLALSKPTYIVVAGAYAIALIGIPTAQRRNWWLAAPLAAAAALTVAWNGLFRDLFLCDVRYFGIPTDPDHQISEIIRRPWDLLGAAARSIADHWRRWTIDLGTIAERVVPWGIGGSAAVVAGFTALGVSPQPSDSGASPAPLSGAQRLILVTVGAATFGAVITGWLISCSPPELVVDNPPHARLLIPALAPVLVGLSLDGRHPVRRVWSAAPIVVAVGYLVWLGAMVARMAI